MSFGVYVHFPYCSARCTYCDFAIHVRRTIPHQRYEAAVRRELAHRAPLYPGRRLRSIYFGGGTPGLWAPESVGAVIAAVRGTFPSERADVEVTLEANPGDLDPRSLAVLRAGGVNRLSLGAQSFAPRHLALLGRGHGPADPARAITAARAAGFENLSIDLMWALPGQTLGELRADLDALAEISPEHVSAYQLTVEDRTPFGALARSRLLPIAPAEVHAEMWQMVERRLGQAGLGRYEVSSYARAGRRAVHNDLYWTSGEWLGLGSAAHSFRRLSVGGERFSTVRSVDAYLAGVERLPAPTAGDPRGPDPLVHDPLVRERVSLDEPALSREAIWLGLRRLDEGIDRAAYAARFGADPIARFPGEFARLVDEGLVEVDPRRAKLSARGALLADEAGARFL